MRLIDAEELFNKVGKIIPRNTTHYKAIGEFMNMITNSPTVQPKQGEWLPIIEGNEFGETYQVGWYCSECGETLGCEANFCPNYGVRMVE